MEVHFSAEQELQISQIASHEGVNPENLVKDAALRLVEASTRFQSAVREGVAQADLGELIGDDEVLSWLYRQERR